MSSNGGRRRISRNLRASLVVAFLTAAATTASAAAPLPPSELPLRPVGATGLDVGFGTGGVIIDSRHDIRLPRAAIDPQGRAVVAGQRGVSPSIWSVLRYTRDGVPDDGFGAGGVADLPVGSYTRILDVAFDRQGRTLVLVGLSAGGSRVVAYTPAGSIDPSFGTGGLVTMVDPTSDDAGDLIVVADDAIVVAGNTRQVGVSISSWARLRRLSSSGVLDPSFGVGGIVDPEIGGEPIQLSRVRSQGDAFLVATRSTIIRLRADGSPDGDFGSAGVVTTGSIPIADVLVEPAGALRVLTDFGESSYVMRYTATGGAAGAIRARGTTMALDPAGRLLVSGSDPVRQWVGRYTQLDHDPSFDGQWLGEIGNSPVGFAFTPAVETLAVSSPVNDRVITVGVANGDVVIAQVITAPLAQPDHPFGSVDLIDGSAPSGVRIAGWVIDPDTASPTQAHVYIDGHGTAITADRTRNDLTTALPAFGANHGFDTTIPIGPGTHTVCIYAYNLGPGTSTLLRCHTINRR